MPTTNRLHHASHRIKIAFGTGGKRIISIPATLDYIHQVEDFLKIPRKTIITECNAPFKRAKFFLAVGSRRWLRATPLISLYTFLLRTASVHVIGNKFNETLRRVERRCMGDAIAARDLVLNIDRLMKGERKVFSGSRQKNYPDGLCTHSIGIHSFSTGIAKSYCPHWYE